MREVKHGLDDGVCLMQSWGFPVAGSQFSRPMYFLVKASRHLIGGRIVIYSGHFGDER